MGNRMTTNHICAQNQCYKSSPQPIISANVPSYLLHSLPGCSLPLLPRMTEVGAALAHPRVAAPGCWQGR
jgi:hypothetical protein